MFSKKPVPSRVNLASPVTDLGYIIYCSSNDNLFSLVFLVSGNFVGLVLTNKLDRHDPRHFCYSLLLGCGPFSLFTLFILFIGSFNTGLFFWEFVIALNAQ